MIRRLLPRGWALVAVLVAALVAAIVVVNALRGDEKDCVSETVAVTPASIGKTVDEVFNIFLAQDEEGPLPFGATWTKMSETADGAVFVTDDQGHWEVHVRGNRVVSYNGCR